ncbi:TonB-dependent receptor [Sphingobium sp.]|uniref:TonB-dependent receptor n=1 Tax=Sphingobium sp. TaxID=1912891 RepID=UPI0026159D4D|nr:TonB-dependent receptor [Sphingobium sp.]
MLTLPASAQTAATAAADDASGGEIIVTAQKRPELLSKTPLSISAVTGDALKTNAVNDAMSLAVAVPTVRIEQANGLRVTIRGVSSADGSEKGDPSAAFMLNGVYLARQQSLSGAFFDVSRIEVLRGPQGTLYGRNATAGVVNIITNSPTDKFEAAVNGEISNYDTYRVDAMVNLPVTEKLAIRAAGAYNKHDSYLVQREGETRKLGNDQDEYAFRLSAEQKFGAEDQGSILIIGDYAHQGGAGPQQLQIGNFFRNPTSTNPTFYNSSSADQRTVNYNFPSNLRQDNKNYGVTGELNYDFGGVGITYLGGYRVFDRYNLAPQAFPNSGAYPDQEISGKTYSQSHEARIATTGDGPLKAVAGLYYFKEKTENLVTLLPNYAGYSLFAFLQDPTIGESKAAFGQATYSVTDKLRVTGGIRYSKDKKSRVGRVVTQRTSTILDPSLYTVTQINDAERSFSKVTWKAGVDYDLTDKVMLYANVSTGYKAGGFNDGCSTTSTSICNSPISEDRLYYRPETLTAYEAGMRGRFMDNALTLNLTGFWYDYSNLQLSSVQEPPAPPGQLTLNAGKARVKGIEAQAVITPTKRDRIDLSFNYLDAYYTQYRPTLVIDFAGKPLDNSPKFTVQTGYTHTFPLANGGDIAAHVDSQLNSDYVNTNFGNGVQFRYPSYTKSNANITYTTPDGRYSVGAFVKNIENTITFSGYASGRIYVSEPRLYGIRAGVKF